MIKTKCKFLDTNTSGWGTNSRSVIYRGRTISNS